MKFQVIFYFIFTLSIFLTKELCGQIISQSEANQVVWDIRHGKILGYGHEIDSANLQSLRFIFPDLNSAKILWKDGSSWDSAMVNYSPIKQELLVKKTADLPLFTMSLDKEFSIITVENRFLESVKLNDQNLLLERVWDKNQQSIWVNHQIMAIANNDNSTYYRGSPKVKFEPKLDYYLKSGNEFKKLNSPARFFSSEKYIPRKKLRKMKKQDWNHIQPVLKFLEGF